jgi:hypothetical protein
MSATRLLTAGIVAGPLFLVVWFAQAMLRDGFDPGRHPISLLALGGAGWIQIANFVVTGLLFIAGAVGMRRALGMGSGGRWVPRLVATFGLGLVLGECSSHVGAGFPAGAPAGRSDMSWYGTIHEFGHVRNIVSFVALVRRYAVRRQRAPAVSTLVALLAALVVGGFPHPETFSVRIVVATAIEFAVVAAVAAELRRDRARTATPAASRLR